jgi:hypothetical protein
MEIKDNFKYDWITDSQVDMIREFVYGLFAGIAVAGQTREEVLGGENNEYWFNWSSDIEVHVFKDDITDDWQATAYQCNEYGQFFGNEFKRITIEDNWS